MGRIPLINPVNEKINFKEELEGQIFCKTGPFELYFLLTFALILQTTIACPNRL